MTDASFLWDDDYDEDFIRGYQSLINSGTAWRLEGSVGREAMSLIDSGICALGTEGFTDYYGNRIPSRHEVLAGTKGSVQFVNDNGNKVME
jgi:hypothetical protein